MWMVNVCPANGVGRRAIIQMLFRRERGSMNPEYPSQQPQQPYQGQPGYPPQQPSYAPPPPGYGQPGYPPQQQYANTAQPSRRGPSSLGSMTAELVSGLAYLSMIIAGPIIPLILFLIEKNPFAKFHAAQATLLSAAVYVIAIAAGIVSSIIFASAAAANSSILGIFGVIPECVAGIVAIAGLVYWIMGMINGFQGKFFKMPLIGDFAERMAGAQGQIQP